MYIAKLFPPLRLVSRYRYLQPLPSRIHQYLTTANNILINTNMLSRRLLLRCRLYYTPPTLPLPHRYPYRHRYLSTTPHATSKPFKQTPSPPRLPPKDQEEFESLQKASMGAFSTSHLEIQQGQGGTSENSISEAEMLRLNINIDPSQSQTQPRVQSQQQKQMEQGQGQHPDLLKGGEKPLFEGDRNPVTGEVGGPKTDPVKYGDWSFNGRVTDF
ncbi:hypothetical protein AA313_de0205138 [Arthrobotrys entomopaga]|nr:hypothetical protein AA313_de0205138 [Arthrobotrys entomopaga]